MTDFSEAYELISKEELSDIGSTGNLYRHKKKRCKNIIISNDDENKVIFSRFSHTARLTLPELHIL